VATVAMGVLVELEEGATKFCRGGFVISITRMVAEQNVAACCARRPATASFDATRATRGIAPSAGSAAGPS
jgi:hypothetical protein